MLRVLQQIGHDLHDLILVGVELGAGLGAQIDRRAGVAVERDHRAYRLFGVERRGRGCGQPGEARELADDVADTRDLVEHGAGGFVEVVVEGGVAARAQAPQRFDRGADR